ncbi:MAG: 3'-5' exonuclease [Bdellovibrionales bacterium]|nr:3'-5' exonuclease [Bdellovibrionales bacterium]
MTIYTAIDTETTGFGTDDRVVEIACVTFSLDVEKPLAIYHTIVDPGADAKMNPEAEKVHGISLERARKYGAKHYQVMAGMLTVIGREVIGHNIEFDVRMINQTLLGGFCFDRWSNKKPKHCTQKMAKKQLPGPPMGAVKGWWRLGNICERYGIDSSGWHSALDDAIMTMHLFRKLKGVSFGKS